jgi:hypothetical protein
MELTALGWVFIPAVAVIAVWFRSWLPAMLVFSAALQAASVLNVPIGDSVYGVSPYWVAAAAVVPFVLANLFTHRPLHFSSSSQRLAALLLALYLEIAIVGAFILPRLFEGTPAYTLLGPIGFGGAPRPLEFGLSHVAQAANAAIHGGVLLYLLQQASRPGWRPQRLLVGLAAAVAMVLMVTAYERLALAGLVPSSANFWMSNPGYSQGHGAEVAGVLRVSAPFSEPSYGSTFLAAALVGMMAVAAFGRRSRTAALAALLVGLGLLNTLGSTGIAGAALCGALILAILSIKAVRMRASTELRRRAGIAWLGVVLALGVMLWLAAASPWSAEVSSVLERGVVEKLAGDDSLSTTSRRHSNVHAMELFSHSYGLGLGLGSNRASSYFASVLSNIGLPGWVLLLSALAIMGRGYLRKELQDREIFAFAWLTGATACVAIGIPDLNIPLYWTCIFVALLLMPKYTATACK